MPDVLSLWLEPSDVSNTWNPPIVHQVREHPGPVILKVGPNVRFGSDAISLLLRVAEVVLERGDRLRVEASRIKVEILAGLGFRNLCTLEINPHDLSGIFPETCRWPRPEPG